MFGIRIGIEQLVGEGRVRGYMVGVGVGVQDQRPIRVMVDCISESTCIIFYTFSVGALDTV